MPYIVGGVSQFMHEPTTSHMMQFIELSTMLKSPLVIVSCFLLMYICVTVYLDADWVGSSDDGHSTSGYCIFV